MTPVNVHAIYHQYEPSNYIFWDEVPGAVEYKVYWGTEPAVTKTSECLTPTTNTNYRHTGVDHSWTYYYRVAAVDAHGNESELSSQLLATLDDTFNKAMITLTSPAITKHGCEKAGWVRFDFGANSNINAGDFWYMDLPSNVAICKPFDYFIIGGAAADIDTINIAGGPTAAVFSGAAKLPAAIAPGAVNGPIRITQAGDAPESTTITGQMALRVVGSGRRVTITAYGSSATDKITVGADTTLSIKILDGDLHNGFVVRDTAIAPATSGDGIYNNALTNADWLAGPVPDDNNTLYINTEAYMHDKVYCSFASSYDKFVFVGDARIAVVDGAVISVPLDIQAEYIPTDGSIFITWAWVPDAVKYKVYWGTDSGVTTGSEF